MSHSCQCEVLRTLISPMQDMTTFEVYAYHMRSNEQSRTVLMLHMKSKNHIVLLRQKGYTWCKREG